MLSRWGVTTSDHQINLENNCTSICNNDYCTTSKSFVGTVQVMVTFIVAIVALIIRTVKVLIHRHSHGHNEHGFRALGLGVFEGFSTKAFVGRSF